MQQWVGVVAVTDALSPAVDLYTELASRLEDDEQRQLLKALLARLAEGGGVAVREEVRTRLRAILEAP